VNFNSFILAFQKYTANEGSLGYTVTFAGFEQFKSAWEIVKNSSYMLKNSLLMFVCKVGVGITLALVFSFYVYKKYPMSGLFRVILFMPQIVSAVVFSLLFKYLVTDVYVFVAGKFFQVTEVSGLLSDPQTSLATTIFYNLWIGFGVNVLLFSGGMSAIDSSLVESAQLDGTNLVQEFVCLTIPMIWPTLVSFLILAVAGIFTDQMNLFTLFGNGASELSSFGYYLYINASTADILPNANGVDYSILSALGLMLTLVLFPTTLLIRYLLNHFGPSED
jgi:ABC-type sugar transport system permease subunit